MVHMLQLVANPEFTRVGCQPQGGASLFLAKFSSQLHKNEENRAESGARPKFTSVDPPLGLTATVKWNWVKSRWHWYFFPTMEKYQQDTFWLWACVSEYSIDDYFAG